MSDFYQRKYLKYKIKYLRQKKRIEDVTYGGREGVSYMTTYNFDYLFRQFIYKLNVRVTLSYYMAKSKKYILLNNVNVMFTTFSGNFGIHVEETQGSNVFTKNTNIIQLGNEGGRIKFTECDDPVKGGPKEVWEIFCYGSDKIITIYPPNYVLKMGAHSLVPFRTVSTAPDVNNPDVLNLYEFVRLYFVQKVIVPLTINKNPKFTFCGLISGGAFAPAGTVFEDLFDNTLGKVIGNIRNIANDEYINNLLDKIELMLYEKKPNDEEKKAIKEKKDYVISKGMRAVSGTLIESLEAETLRERGYCVTPNQSLNFSSFISKVSGTWADVETYFRSDANIVGSQMSVYDDKGSKVKLLHDKNNLFVLAHGPTAKKGKGGALDEELNDEIWYHKLVAINTQVMCIALIHVAFYSGQLEPNRLADLFNKLELQPIK